MKDDVIQVDGDVLKSFIERIERVAAERAELAEDMKEIFTEAKDAGFNTKVMRRVISDRKRDRESVDGERAIYDLYIEALGEFAGTPLGAAAVERAAPRVAKKAKSEAEAKPAAAAKPAKAAAPVATLSGATTARTEKPSDDEVRDLKEIGRRAGLAGKERDTNPNLPGSVDAQLWDTGWGLGHQEKVDQEALADGGNQRPARAKRPPLFAPEESTAVN